MPKKTKHKFQSRTSVNQMRDVLRQEFLDGLRGYSFEIRDDSTGAHHDPQTLFVDKDGKRAVLVIGGEKE